MINYLSDNDKDALGKMPPEEAQRYLTNHVQTKKLTGIERLTYLFTEAYIGWQYLIAAFWLFGAFFSATIITSFFNTKQKTTA